MIRIEAATNENGSVSSTCSMSGETNQLINELAGSTAWAIVEIARGLPVLDDLHESLATVVCSEILATVRRLQETEEEKSDSAGGFLPGDPTHMMDDGAAEESEGAASAEGTENK